MAHRIRNERHDHEADGEGSGNDLEAGQRGLHFALQLQGFQVVLYLDGIPAMPDDLTMGRFRSPARRDSEKKPDYFELPKLTLYVPIWIDTLAREIRR